MLSCVQHERSFLNIMHKMDIAMHERVKRSKTDSNCGDIWIDGDFFLGIAATALAAAAFALNQAIIDAGKKKRRKRSDEYPYLSPLEAVNKGITLLHSSKDPK